MPAFDPHDLSDEALRFLGERHLATISTVRSDGRLHVVPVGFTFEPSDATVRVICSDGSRKIRNIEGGCRVAVCQADGPRWISFEGSAVVLRDWSSVDDAVRRYAVRYRDPRPNPNRVAIHMTVERVLGSSSLRRVG